MNAVEIEEAISQLVETPFDAAEFPYAFLEAFGNKSVTLQKLRSTGKNTTNKSDVSGDQVHAVLQRSNIHIATRTDAKPDAVAELFQRLVDSPATTKYKAKFILATDGQIVHAASLESEDPPLVCQFKELADHFGYFLELAGISTVRQIRENAFDIKATGRLNRLYVELLRNNPDWDGDERREDLNHFFARLIFCFFAEDTGILHGNGLFTETIRQMSDSSGNNTDFVLSEIFRAMDVPMRDRDAANLRPWAGQFPYVNGGLFGSVHAMPDRSTVPKFTQIARSYLLHIGSLDWTQINPDIFGSMIQAVADDEERGALGMHYTSVPNILKVLNPLFLDDLKEQLTEAGNSPRKLLNLRKRLARIRVFDPACGSGNFLVIAYKEMRAIEAEINARRGEPERKSEIPLTNFRGIELRHFAVEVARLALIIAEYQCDELYRGQRLALAEFLPLNKENWITHGNALRLDWLKVCPGTGTGGVKLVEDDLFQTPLDQTEIDFENEGGETYICGNPPYLGNKLQTAEQKADLANVFGTRITGWKSLDYVAGWFMKAADYGTATNAASAFVTTNSLCQGQQVALLWPTIFKTDHHIQFAYTSFKWANLASHKAGVIVAVVCISNAKDKKKHLYEVGADGSVLEKLCSNINPYLVDGPDVVVEAQREAPSDRPPMLFGNMPRDGGNLLVSFEDKSKAIHDLYFMKYLRQFAGSEDSIHGKPRYCLWIDKENHEAAINSPIVAKRLEEVRKMRLASKAESTREYAKHPYRFVQIQGVARYASLLIPRHSSSRRTYLPVAVLTSQTIVADSAFAIYDAPLWVMAILVSRMHLTWIAAVCGQLKTDYRYSNTLGWNTFPLPVLTVQNIRDLEDRATEILIARESYFPATLSEMYDPDEMSTDFPRIRSAHIRNDEVVERIYSGRVFKNDTERLKELFDLFVSRDDKSST